MEFFYCTKKQLASVVIALIVATVVGLSYAEEQALPATPEAAIEEQQEFPATAHATIEQVSNELLANLDQLRAVYEQSPEDFYAEIDAIVSPWFDYAFFCKAVMGKTYYTEATEEQRVRFREVCQKTLIETYGKGLLGVEQTRFEIEPPATVPETGRPVSVKQTLFSATDRMSVIYAMGRSAEGSWKVKNVLLEGINLGQTLKNQFARSAQEHSGDLDQVIANWSPTT